MKRILYILFFALTSNLITAQEFEKPKLLNRSVWGFGAGLTVGSLPVATSDFKMPITTLFYDYTLTNVNSFWNGFVKPGFSVGLYGLNGFVPIPETELYAMVNEGEDLSLRLGVGGFYDILIGGHSGLTLKAGVVINQDYQVDIISVPSAKQPVKPYSEIVDGGPENIKTPYFGLVFSWRFPNH